MPLALPLPSVDFVDADGPAGVRVRRRLVSAREKIEIEEALF